MYFSERGQRWAEATTRANYCNANEGGEGNYKYDGLDHAPILTVRQKIFGRPTIAFPEKDRAR